MTPKAKWLIKSKLYFSPRLPACCKLLCFCSSYSFSKDWGWQSSISGLWNYVSWAKSSLPSVFVNKILLKSRHGHSFTHYLCATTTELSSCNGDGKTLNAKNLHFLTFDRIGQLVLGLSEILVFVPSGRRRRNSANYGLALKTSSQKWHVVISAHISHTQARHMTTLEFNKGG